MDIHKVSCVFVCVSVTKVIDQVPNFSNSGELHQLDIEHGLQLLIYVIYLIYVMFDKFDILSDGSGTKVAN